MENIDRLGQITREILASADSVLNDEKNEVNIGSLITYAEVLTIIQEQLTDAEKKNFKLDFDIDKKYM